MSKKKKSRTRSDALTEQEWLTCSYPTPMLAYLLDKASDRKLRLFACACCRRIWHLLTDERSQAAVEVAERFADGEATEDERQAAEQAACNVHQPSKFQYPDPAGPLDECATKAAHVTVSSSSTYDGPNLPTGGLYGWAASNAADAVAYAGFSVSPDNKEAGFAASSIALVEQTQLLRDVVGNPFRPVTLDPSWLTPAVVTLAQSIYDERAFDRMPHMADALEKVDCDNADILAHCRQPGKHVRGCWVVDLILGKG